MRGFPQISFREKKARMPKKFFIYTDKLTAAAVSKAIWKKGSIVKIESLSQLHFACRNIKADALFIGEEEWTVFGCTAMHPYIAPKISFPIIAVSAFLDNPWGKRQIVFRLVSIPEKQKSYMKATGMARFMHLFFQTLPLFFAGISVKILSADELPQEAESSRKKEEQLDHIRSLCLHKKCREIFDLIVKSGNKGASIDSIQLQAWPDSVKSRRGDVQSYVCKIRKIMREHGGINCKIIYKDNKYFFVQETETSGK